MRVLVAAVVLCSAASASTGGQAESAGPDALRLAAEVRWVGKNCYAIKVDWTALQTYLKRSGLDDPFDPDGPNQPYLKQREASLDADLLKSGTKSVCKIAYSRLSSTGFIAPKTLRELSDLNDIRLRNGGEPVQLLDLSQ